MSDEEALTIYQETGGDLAIAREPAAVLAEAQKAARALKDVVDSKQRPVTFNGKRYLEFEDWQTVARFYGITPKVETTEYLERGETRGFSATAVAIRNDGMIVGRAIAECSNDEPNWKNKPLFQLSSMAQTRAQAKVLRSVLAWVVVLAGYAPTPAEEMDGVFAKDAAPTIKPPTPKAKPAQAPQATITDDAVITAQVIEDDVPTVTGVFLLNVLKKDGVKNGKPWARATFEASNGKRYSTFDAKVAEVGEAAISSGTCVDLAYREGKFGNDLLAITASAMQSEEVPF